MRFKISVYALLVTVVFVMSSCLSDSETDVEYYDDTAVTSMSFGTLKCTYHTTKKNSTEDSTYVRNISGSAYPIHIDALKHEIFNVDSLPLGTDMEHILLNVTTKNSGVATLKSLISDSIRVISSSDSLDFSQPREIIVYSNSGRYNQTYKVNFCVHKEKADDFRWQECSEKLAVAAYEKVKAVAFDGFLYVLGTTDSGAELVRMSTENTTSAWSAVDVKVGTDEPVTVSLGKEASVLVADGKLFVLNSGKLYSTVDGNAWSEKTASGIAMLLGTCGNEMFALSEEGEMKVSMDGGATWNMDRIDSDKAYLPSQDVSYIASVTSTNADVSRIVMIGNRYEKTYTSDTKAVVWSKIVDEDSSKDQDWAYNEFDESNNYALPCLAGLSVISYAEGMIAIGGKGLASSDNKGFTKMYFSIDNGVTWHEDARFKLPTDFDASQASLTVDAKNHIWIVCTGTGQVWRGRLNRLGWAIDK